MKADGSEWMVLNECHVLSKMRSPFVLGLKYSFHEQDSLYLIIDMCAGGDLKVRAPAHTYSQCSREHKHRGRPRAHPTQARSAARAALIFSAMPAPPPPMPPNPMPPLPATRGPDDESALMSFFVCLLCDCYDLQYHLRASKDRCFEPQRAKFYACEVLLGLEHIHSQNIVYRSVSLFYSSTLLSFAAASDCFFAHCSSLFVLCVLMRACLWPLQGPEAEQHLVG